MYNKATDRNRDSRQTLLDNNGNPYPRDLRGQMYIPEANRQSFNEEQNDSGYIFVAHVIPEQGTLATDAFSVLDDNKYQYDMNSYNERWKQFQNNKISASEFLQYSQEQDLSDEIGELEEPLYKLFVESIPNNKASMARGNMEKFVTDQQIPVRYMIYGLDNLISKINAESVLDGDDFVKNWSMLLPLFNFPTTLFVYSTFLSLQPFTDEIRHFLLGDQLNRTINEEETKYIEEESKHKAPTPTRNRSLSTIQEGSENSNPINESKGLFNDNVR